MDSVPFVNADYPEMAKASAISDEFDICRNFILWMADEKGIELSIHDSDRMVPCMETTDDLLMQFFGIDRSKIIEERLRAIEDYRKFQDATTQETTPSHPQTGVSGAL